MKSFFNFQVI